VARGVDVTLFATADSQTSARLVAVAPRGYAEDPTLDAKVYECLHIAAAFEQTATGAFDILHNHFDFLPLTYSRLVSTPLVTTVHGLSSERILPVYRAYNPSQPPGCDQCGRPPPGSALRRHHPPWHPPGRVHAVHQSWRLLTVLRTYPSAQRCARSGGRRPTDRPKADSGWHHPGCRLFSGPRSGFYLFWGYL